MFIMLTQDKYDQGLNILEFIKYNIEYDKSPIFNIVRSGLASKLLTHEYAVDLTDEQRSALECVINK